MEKLRSSLLTLVLVLLLSLSALASASGSPTPLGTNVGGSICANTTWSAAGSPYTVTSSVYVCPGVTLTVQPGVTVKFNDNLGMAIDGALVANGTAAQPILFTSSRATPVPGSWAFIKFNDPSQDATFDGSGNYVSGSILGYATVEYAGSVNPPNGAIWLDRASPFIDHRAIVYFMLGMVESGHVERIPVGWGRCRDRVARCRHCHAFSWLEYRGTQSQ